MVSRLDVRVITQALCKDGNFFEVRAVIVMIEVNICNDLHRSFFVLFIPLELVLFSLLMHTLCVYFSLPLFVAVSSKDKRKNAVIQAIRSKLNHLVHVEVMRKRHIASMSLSPERFPKDHSHSSHVAFDLVLN